MHTITVSFVGPSMLVAAMWKADVGGGPTSGGFPDSGLPDPHSKPEQRYHYIHVIAYLSFTAY